MWTQEDRLLISRLLSKRHVPQCYLRGFWACDGRWRDVFFHSISSSVGDGVSCILACMSIYCFSTFPTLSNCILRLFISLDFLSPLKNSALSVIMVSSIFCFSVSSCYCVVPWYTQLSSTPVRFHHPPHPQS